VLRKIGITTKDRSFHSYFDVGTAEASGMAASGMAKKPIFLLSETSEEEARRKVCSR
jgi:hypothetical protein